MTIESAQIDIDQYSGTVPQPKARLPRWVHLSHASRHSDTGRNNVRKRRAGYPRIRAGDGTAATPGESAWTRRPAGVETHVELVLDFSSDVGASHDGAVLIDLAL